MCVLVYLAQVWKGHILQQSEVSIVVYVATSQL